VPNLLTADGNEVNDKFEISTFCPVKSYRLRLYNRWGKEVFASENPTEIWDPKSAGNGTYFYAIDLLYEDGSSEALRGWLDVVK
jgi:gliding motility-associated-like protein